MFAGLPELPVGESQIALTLQRRRLAIALSVLALNYSPARRHVSGIRDRLAVSGSVQREEDPAEGLRAVSPREDVQAGELRPVLREEEVVARFHCVKAAAPGHALEPPALGASLGAEDVLQAVSAGPGLADRRSDQVVPHLILAHAHRLAEPETGAGVAGSLGGDDQQEGSAEQGHRVGVVHLLLHRLRLGAASSAEHLLESGSLAEDGSEAVQEGGLVGPRGADVEVDAESRAAPQEDLPEWRVHREDDAHDVIPGALQGLRLVQVVAAGVGGESLEKGLQGDAVSGTRVVHLHEHASQLGEDRPLLLAALGVGGEVLGLEHEGVQGRAVVEQVQHRHDAAERRRGNLGVGEEAAAPDGRHAGSREGG